VILQAAKKCRRKVEMSPDVQSRDVTTGRGAGVGGTCSRQGDCGKRNLFGTRGRWLVGGLSEKEPSKAPLPRLRLEPPQSSPAAAQRGAAGAGLDGGAPCRSKIGRPSVAPTRSVHRPSVAINRRASAVSRWVRWRRGTAVPSSTSTAARAPPNCSAAAAASRRGVGGWADRPPVAPARARELPTAACFPRSCQVQPFESYRTI